MGDLLAIGDHPSSSFTASHQTRSRGSRFDTELTP
jgi:hypothetical protein